MNQRSWYQKVKDHFVPHEGNGYRPSVLAVQVCATLLVLALLIEGVYVIQKEVVFKQTDFLASVLPGVLISLTNADRALNGAGQVSQNDLLTQAAKLKAEDMAEKGYFAHTTPDGKEPWYWLDLAGYNYTYAGENLAVNFEDSKEVEEAWMNSPAHHANIVKPQYTEIGIATAQGMYKGKEVTFVVQFFASPKVVAAAPTTPIAAVEEEVPVTSAPVEEIIVVEEPSPNAPAVLSAELSEAATAPNTTATFALSVLALVASVLLLIAIAAHVRLPYTEGLAGAVALLIVVVGLMTFNAYQLPTIELPSDSAAAAVILAH